MPVSVIIPAYNEEHVLGRLLSALDDPALRQHLEVIVVCNGCTDRTADVAVAHPLNPQVVSLAQGSKHAALMEGDRLATGFPRLYVDADVEITARDVLLLASRLDEDGALAVAPGRELRLVGRSWLVRAYYRIWEQLPAVQDGLFGRGVVGVSEEGFARIASRPKALGDDLYVHCQFSPAERRIVPEATSVVYGPTTVRDLVKRRMRAVRGNIDLRTVDVTSATSPSSIRHLVGTVARHPREIPAALVFLGVTGVARAASRHQTSDNWMRDESSRVALKQPR
jgi:glycosyltransferase involved in cell wall biosynthesis